MRVILTHNIKREQKSKPLHLVTENSDWLKREYKKKKESHLVTGLEKCKTALRDG